jgi:hypothetical protein
MNLTSFHWKLQKHEFQWLGPTLPISYVASQTVYFDAYAKRQILDLRKH